MAGEELFGGFTTHYQQRTIVSSSYTQYGYDLAYYMHGHRPYAYTNMHNDWYANECTLILSYWDYSSGGWEESARVWVPDEAARSVRATVADAIHEFWRLYVETDYNDGKQRFDSLYMRIYDAAYLQRTDGISMVGKYVMKPDMAYVWSSSATCSYKTGEKIYAGDFLMVRVNPSTNTDLD
jgi:hypothetical protein